MISAQDILSGIVAAIVVFIVSYILVQVIADFQCDSAEEECNRAKLSAYTVIALADVGTGTLAFVGTRRSLS